LLLYRLCFLLSVDVLQMMPPPHLLLSTLPTRRRLTQHCWACCQQISRATSALASHSGEATEAITAFFQLFMMAGEVWRLPALCLASAGRFCLEWPQQYCSNGLGGHDIGALASFCSVKSSTHLTGPVYAAGSGSGPAAAAAAVGMTCSAGDRPHLMKF
jgi:hypothetical protein